MSSSYAVGAAAAMLPSIVGVVFGSTSFMVQMLQFWLKEKIKKQKVMKAASHYLFSQDLSSEQRLVITEKPCNREEKVTRRLIDL